ncbi:hypothetical protein [Amnibacterium kyonggiense]
MNRQDHPHYRRTGPVPVSSPPTRPPHRRVRRRWAVLLSVVLGVQGGWIGSVALAQSEPPTPSATASPDPAAATAAPTATSTPSRTAEDPDPTSTATPTPTRQPDPSGGPRPAQRTVATDLALRPFAADSPWNTPIGAGAVYSAADDVVTRSLVSSAGRATINSTAWSVPVAIAGAGDPTTRVAVSSGITADHRMPPDARGSADTDAELAVIDGSHSYEYWGLTGGSGGWSARFGGVVDLTGSGTTGGVRASGFSLLGGLIRVADTRAPIDHALVVALAADQLRTGPVLPARSEDGDAASSYSGAVRMGTHVAIPRAVDLGSLHLSQPALRLATALQDYGAYVGDRSSQLTLYAEPDAEGGALQSMRDALRTELAPLLRVVTAD